ncbi:MobF family relaxase [Luteimonas dalianensis]|uniref:MobF family relaxase n=1 Tax=Luteimonas dalianensis TaxID=1148196 RepID=UPI003BF449D4
MISVSRLNARGNNANGENVVDYLLATEYYFDKEGERQDTMRWGGKLAADPQLNLAGQAVTKEDMLALAAGFAPDGTPLCKNAGALPTEKVKLDRAGKPRLDKDGSPIVVLEGGHRVGFDFTFSAPKPFSIAFALAEGAERDAILAAHRRAVDVGMGYLESKVETRRGAAGRDVIATAGLIYSQHDHMANRDLEPNLHVHTLVYGVAKGEDGQWGTFDARELYRHRMSADAVYKNELAANMRELGYAIETTRVLNEEGKDTGQVEWKLAGLSDEICDRFSSRRQAILAYQAEHDVDAQTACLATRRHKDEPAYAELVAMWKQTIDDMGDLPSIEQLKDADEKLMEPGTTADVLEKLHASEAYFSDHHLIDVLGNEYAGQLRFDELLAKVEAFKHEQGLVRVEAERLHADDQGRSLSRRHTEDRYAASWMVDWEREVVHRVASRVGEDHQKVDADRVEQAIHDYEQRKGFQLSDEQRKAVEHLTMGTGGVGVLQGLAGTGKTTVSDCYSAAFQAQGRTMRGVCVSNAAAEKLEQESGMPCQSVALFLSRLDREKDKLTRQDVIVVDEAGMLDTNQTRRILAHAHLAGCKVIVQGDTQQLQPIGAGSGMSLARAAVGSAKLTEIRRQARVEDRETAGLYYPRDEQGQVMDLSSATPRSQSQMLEHGRAVLGALDRAGAIDEFTTKNQAMEGLVHDYLEHAAPVNDKLVLAHARHEVSALNLAIRDGLKTRGLISPRESIIQAKENGRAQDLPLSNGDRVRFTSRIKELGVVNGTRAVVLANRPNAEGGVDLKVRVQSDNPKHDGRVLTFNSNEHSQLAHDYASTVHKAQGQGKKEVFHLANLSMMDNQSTLVAFTRLTGGNYRLYATEEEAERLAERFGMDRLKGNALEAGLKDQAHALTGNDTAWFESQAQQFAAKLRARQGQSTRPRRLEHKASL